jgi:hypothetical protein
MNRFEEGPAPEASQENIEQIDREIADLVETLNSFEFNDFSREVQDEWYEVEMQGLVGKDRPAAKSRLEAFIAKLEALGK